MIIIGVINISDRASAGVYEDPPGKTCVELLRGWLATPFEVAYAVIPEELLRSYDESGLTRAAFARREGVKYATTFAHWVQARRARGEAPLAHTGGKPVRFAEVGMPVRPNRPSEARGLSVTMPDGLIVRGTDAAGMAAMT